MNNNKPQKKEHINFEVTPEMKGAVEKLRGFRVMSLAAYMRELIREDAIKNNVRFTSIADQPGD